MADNLSPTKDDQANSRNECQRKMIKPIVENECVKLTWFKVLWFLIQKYRLINKIRRKKL